MWKPRLSTSAVDQCLHACAVLRGTFLGCSLAGHHKHGSHGPAPQEQVDAFVHHPRAALRCKHC
eukprot:665330-Pelagomonas_calceolata.AAC.4